MIKTTACFIQDIEFLMEGTSYHCKVFEIANIIPWVNKLN